MNWETIEAQWAKARGKVRETWGKLTDDDMERIGGAKDQLVGAIQEKYGVAKEEAQRQVDKFASSFSDS